MRVSTCARAECACFVRGGEVRGRGKEQKQKQNFQLPRGRAKTRRLFARSYFANRAGNYTDLRDLPLPSDVAIHHPRDISTSAINGFRGRFDTIKHSDGRSARWHVALSETEPPFEAVQIFFFLTISVRMRTMSGSLSNVSGSLRDLTV